MFGFVAELDLVKGEPENSRQRSSRDGGGLRAREALAPQVRAANGEGRPAGLAVQLLPRSRRWFGSVGEAVQAEGELDLQGAVGGLPVGPQELAHAIEPLGDRVDVDVQRLRRTGQ